MWLEKRNASAASMDVLFGAGHWFLDAEPSCTNRDQPGRSHTLIRAHASSSPIVARWKCHRQESSADQKQGKHRHQLSHAAQQLIGAGSWKAQALAMGASRALDFPIGKGPQATEFSIKYASGEPRFCLPSHPQLVLHQRWRCLRRLPCRQDPKCGPPPPDHHQFANHGSDHRGKSEAAFCEEAEAI
jgi:hypothetical protein